MTAPSITLGTINGAPNFPISPTVPTPTLGDSSQLASSTAFVAAAVAVEAAARAAAITTVNASIAAVQVTANSAANGLHFAGTWNASTNSPALTSGTGTAGAIYKVATAGTTTLDGISNWNIGDAAVFSNISNTWVKFDGVTTEVLSVVGLTGAVTASQISSALSLSGLATATIGGTGLTLTSGVLSLTFGTTTGSVGDGGILATVQAGLATEITARQTAISTVTASATQAQTTANSAQTIANAAMPNTTSALITLLNAVAPLLANAATPGTPTVWLDGNFFIYA
jgi:hypothetical protein